MRRSFSILTFFIVVLLAGSVFASGVGLTGIGARATALGGNFRAVANDWSAMYWNPAGITQLQGWHFGFSTEAIMPVGSYTFKQNSTMPFSLFRTDEIENESKTFLIPAAGVVYGMGKMSFGLAVYVPFGLGAEWDALNTAAYSSAYSGIDYEDDLKVIDIQPTFAYQVNDKLSVGVGVSLTYADILIRKPTTTPNSLLFDPAYATLKAGVLALMDLDAATYNHVLTEQELTGDGMGVGFNFGLKYKVTDCFAVGLSGIYYNTISLDGNINATTYGAEIPAAVLTQLSGTLDALIGAGQLTDAQKQQILAIYSGQEIPKYTDAKGDADLPLPMTLGVGFAYTGIEKLLVSADLSWTQWSSWDVIEIAMEDGSTSELVENWEDGMRFGLGLEYCLTEKLGMRAGLYSEPAAPPNETMTITIPDPERRYSITAGFSYDFGLAKFFASYENIIIGDRDVANWEYNATAQGYDNMAGKYGMTVNNIMAGLNFAF